MYVGVSLSTGEARQNNRLCKAPRPEKKTFGHATTMVNDYVYFMEFQCHGVMAKFCISTKGTPATPTWQAF